MSGSRTAPRIVLAAAIAFLVVSIIGFVVTLLMDVLVWDKYDAYGEVPVPGSASLHLPQGEVTVSFHTQVIGIDGGLPIPDMGMTIEPPDGAPEPTVTEDIGATTTVNQDARVQVWVAQIPQEGTYRITTEGNVSAFINPRLAFGHGSSLGWLPAVFGVLMAVSILDVIVVAFWLVRARATPAVTVQDGPDFDRIDDEWDEPVDAAESDAQVTDAGYPDAEVTDAAPGEYRRATVTDSPTSFEPTEDGIRLQHLKTLAALRDSGALTEDEFKSEKKRLLDGR